MNDRPVITQLSDQLANMIAAGEVVERPVSIVKELVENSLDAESSIIKIDLIDSGLTKLIVTDNGIGMNKDEIPLALKRHATSKIKNVNDLFYITSLGFRGEALPSIASVSYFTIMSSTDGINGYRYVYHGLTLIESTPCALPKGTKIIIENLFYNTPARLKHINNQTLELSHIINYLNKVVIANPKVAFTVTNNNKVLFQTSGKNDLLEIIATIYGIQTAKNCLYFEGKNNLYQICGYTTNNSSFRSNKNSLTVLVNKRIIRNQSMLYAITDAYKTILPVGKYPVTILDISTDPSLIDVNVHPSKLEIRFTDESLLKYLITNTIIECLQNKELIYSESVEPIKKENTEDIDININTKKESIEINSNLNTETSNVSKKLDLTWDDFPEETVLKEEDLNDESYDKSNESSNEEADISLLKEESTSFFTKLTYLGQYHQTYLLMEYEDDLYLIDQHAAMERCMYEQISKEFLEPDHHCYDLLVPIQLDFNLSEVPLIINKEKEINSLGILFEPFGGTTILIRTIPIWIPEGLETVFLADIINHIINETNVSKAKMYDSLAKSLSCKKSIKASTIIRQDEVENLMKRLDNCKMPYTCPHGRPIMIKFTLFSLEKMFKRIN